jgi:c(7)-type cytochrome triheme protein
MKPHRPAGRLRASAAVAVMLAAIAAAAGFRALADESLGAPPVLDPTNEAYGQLQRPADAFSGLPLDRRGRVDWMKALREGLIQPRADLKGESTMSVLKLDIIMRNTAQMPYVRFPHESHTMWLECSNCHDAIFVPKAGANPINMAKIVRGEYCGVCHDRVAFMSLFDCERCHSVLREGEKGWWADPAASGPTPPAEPARRRPWWRPRRAGPLRSRLARAGAARGRRRLGFAAD